MQFKKSALWKDINDVTTTGSYHYTGMWLMTIHTSKSNFKPLYLTNIDFKYDFVNEVSEVVMVSFVIDRGAYLYDLYPHLHNLEVTLERFVHNAPDPKKAITKPTFKQKYKAIYLPELNHRPRGTEEEFADKTSLSILPPVTATLQLMNLHVEPLRIKMASGIIKGFDNTTNIKAFLHSELDKVSLPTGKVIDVVDVAPADNKTPVRHFIIPSNTSLLSVPSIAQEQLMGMYNGGFGTFVTKVKDYKTNKMISKFYVYPTHKPVTNRQDIILYAMPSFMLAYNENTFKISGKHLKIVGHVNGSYKEDDKTKTLERGIGFRMPNAKSFMKKPVIMTASGPVGSEEKLNYKVAITSRADQNNIARRDGQYNASANPFRKYSDLVKQVGNYVSFVWQYSDHTLLEPSMPVTLYYLNSENKTTKVKGVLTQFNTVIQSKGTGMVNRAGFTEITILRFYLSDYLS